MPKLGRLEPEYHPHYVAYAADPSPRATSALLKAVDPVIRLGVQTYGGGDSAVMRGRSSSSMSFMGPPGRRGRRGGFGLA
jgi:hypothetical protein